MMRYIGIYVTGCTECPFRDYIEGMSFGVHDKYICTLLEEPMEIPEGITDFPSWCPIPCTTTTGG